MAVKRIVRPAPEPVKGVSKKVNRSLNGDDEEEAPRPSKAASSTKKVPAAPRNDGTTIRSGWSAAEETADSTSSYAQALKLSSNTQIIKFLQAAPYASFRRHWIDRVGIGKRAYTCLQSFGKDCPLCDIGDKPQAVAAFNVAVVGDDSEALVKTWDAGVKIMNVIKGFANDPKIGPLNKPNLYFGVSKSEASKRQQVQTNIFPIRARDMQEDYDRAPLSEAHLASLMTKLYDAEIITVTSRKELEDIAAEMIDEDAPSESQTKGWGDDD